MKVFLLFFFKQVKMGIKMITEIAESFLLKFCQAENTVFFLTKTQLLDPIILCQLWMGLDIPPNVQSVFLWTASVIQTCPYRPLNHLC